MLCEHYAVANGRKLAVCKACKSVGILWLDGLCKDCWEKTYVRCNHCGERVHRQNSVAFHCKVCNSVAFRCKVCTVSLARRERITHNVSVGMIDTYGIDKLNHILSFPDFPRDWNWSTMVKGKGEYVGSLPKRIAKFIYQTKGIKLTNDLLGEIGSIINQHTNKHTSYTFDFTDKFDWDSGDYGDSGSCFWGCRNSARGMLEGANGRAIRFYNEEGKGYARAWLMPVEDNQYVIFNGYGEETINCTRIFADFMNLSYRRVDLSNNEAVNGTIWINGGLGYIVGREEDINNKNCYNLDIEDDIDDSPICEDCGRHCGEDYTALGDGYACENCIDNYSYCDCCDEYFHATYCSIVHHTDTRGWTSERVACESCRRENYTKCDECGEFHNKTFTATKDGNEREICQRCKESDYYVCEHCDTLVHSKNCKTVREGRYQKVICDDCLGDGYRSDTQLKLDLQEVD